MKEIFHQLRMAPVRPRNLNHIVRLLFGQAEATDLRQGRILGVLQGVATSLGSRAISILVSLLSVPLTIGYLGTELYGAWITLGSMLAWLGLSDFGLGNGLMNAVTSAVAQEQPELARKHVTNGVFLLSIVAITAGVLAYFVWPCINWSTLFGVTSVRAKAEIGPAVMAAVIIFLLQFPLAISGKIYLAHREGRIDNYWSMAANLFGLLVLLLVTHTHGGLVWLVISISGTSLAVNIVNTSWLFWWHKPHLRPSFQAIDVSTMHPLLHVGGKFFLIQLLALIVFQTDNLVISHYIGAARVPEYNLTYRVFEYA
ncbi:MAG TPA: oligosaccharide flippase family protein, partial [Halothiobacillus sp.]|nr:oligosaccharide flippase family protein [Halothiobacillus sp.]